MLKYPVILMKVGNLLPPTFKVEVVQKLTNETFRFYKKGFPLIEEVIVYELKASFEITVVGGVVVTSL